MNHDFGVHFPSFFVALCCVAQLLALSRSCIGRESDSNSQKCDSKSTLNIINRVVFMTCLVASSVIWHRLLLPTSDSKTSIVCRWWIVWAISSKGRLLGRGPQVHQDLLSVVSWFEVERCPWWVVFQFNVFFLCGGLTHLRGPTCNVWLHGT